MRLPHLALAVALALTLAPAGCRDRRTHQPGDVYTGVAPPPAPVHTGGSCEAIATCDACSATPGCDFCTDPRACVREGTPCRGLTLSHPSTCTNDPAVGGSQRARALAAMHAAVVAELRDMAPGPRIDARLEGLTSLSFPIPAQSCYSLVWVVGDEATLRDATLQLDFIGPRGSTGASVTSFSPVGWSGRACTSVAGTLVANVVTGPDNDRPTVAGRGPVAFVLNARHRNAADTDEGGAAPARR